MIEVAAQRLHDIFATIAARFPERVALEIPPGHARADRCCWTYARLLERSAEFRDAVLADLRPDAVASILLPRESPDLYAAQLGVLMANGAFSCLDPRFPDEHLRSVLAETDAEVLITDAAGAGRLEALGIAARRLLLTADVPLGAPAGPEAATRNGLECEPRHLAYVIYTSGTTGRPKGVMIEHRSIVNLVLYDVAEFGLGPDDRVAQCSSPAYDSSIDETWLAFAVGATLVVLDDETVRLGPDLVPWLRRERITAFCPPPTLLRATGCADPESELPDLRFLYVGGEALPQDLADRWARGRRMDNGYGPTECSIVITRGRVRPGEPVTIGQAVTGNVAHVLGAQLEPVADGEPGELCLSGVGLARGYRGRRGLTAERFPNHPRWGRIYRTGDLVRRNEAGDLEYLGRLDGQVKLRGYRVELGAVEAHLAACAGVRAAACRVQGEGAAQILVAHVVARGRPRAAELPAIEDLRAELRGRLPEYMVPARIAWIDELPTTVGGKLDRRALPEVAGAATANGAATATGGAAEPFAADAPADAIEQVVAAAFARAIGHGVAPPPSADFFLDLGGDSLGAVAVVVALREAGHEEAAVRDVYEARTVVAIAERLRARLAGNRARPWVAAAGSERGDLRCSPPISTACQGLWLALELWLFSALAYFTLFRWLPWLAQRIGLATLLALAPVLSFAALALWLGLSVSATIAAKAILIGRYRECRIPVWSGAFTRHWIVTHTARLIPWGWLEGTALYGAVLRLLGAKVGRRVHIHRGVDLHHGGWDLLELGDDVTLCQEAALRLVEFEDGHLVVGAVRLGAGVTVETRAGLSPGSAMEANSFLCALSWLPPATRVPAGQRWDGVPATAAGPAPPAPDLATDPALSPANHGALEIAARFASRLLAWIPLVALGSWFLSRVPGLREGTGVAKLLFTESTGPWQPVTVLVLLTILSAPISLFAQALVLRLQGRVPEGTFSIWGRQALAVWYKTGVVDAAGRWLSGSLFWPWWLRLAGMRIGKRCEISTIIDVVPETVSIDDESFFADGIYFCQPRYHRGGVSVSQTALGRHTFLGNHAVVPAGTSWPDDLFVGVATVADPERARPDSAWFGHPPMALPRREVIAADRRLTYEPDALRFATRLFWETARFLLPALPAVVLFAWARAVHDASSRLEAPVFFGVFLPLASLAAIAAPALAVVAAKWSLLGRVQPGQHAFWSCWCGRWDWVYMAWSQWARGSLNALEGTLLLNAFLRLTGVRIGRRVVLGAGFTQVVDPDMLEFEDDATVSCQFQAHTFEDRILKIDHLRIRRGATVGANTVVFYGADIGPGARVAPHGVVMKRDVLTGHRAYAGNPARELAENGGGAAGAWTSRALEVLPTPSAAEGTPLQAT